MASNADESRVDSAMWRSGVPLAAVMALIPDLGRLIGNRLEERVTESLESFQQVWLRKGRR